MPLRPIGLCLLSAFTGHIAALPALSQTVIPPSDEFILPQFALNGSTTADRVQYVCRLRLTGLLPNATYRYFTGASNNPGITTSTAPGNYAGIDNVANAAGYIQGQTSSKVMSGSLLGNNEFTNFNRYSQLATDANGEYVGWFAVVPTSNAAFNAGNNVFVYVQLNDGSGGTTVASAYRTTSTVKMLKLGTNLDPNEATVAYGTSNQPGEHFVFLYDNVTGSGRPLVGTWTESDGVTTNWTGWYEPLVGNNPGSWGTILPNQIIQSVKRLECRDINAAVIASAESTTGYGVGLASPGGIVTPLKYSFVPGFRVTHPNGGENLFVGGTPYITWDTAGSGATFSAVHIFISNDGGANYVPLAVNAINTGSWPWPTQIDAGADYRVRVLAPGQLTECPGDDSDASFSVAPPAIHASIVDCSTGTPVVDGTLGVDEYGPGNSYAFEGGGTGFGGVLAGSNRLYMKSTSTHLHLGFQPGASIGGNAVVVYFDTRAGGFTDLSMNDTAFPEPAVVTNLTRDSDDGFPFGADFALLMSAGGCFLYELKSGPLIFIPFGPGDTSNCGSPTALREVRIPLSAIAAGAPAATIDFFAALCSLDNYSSNETIPPIATINSAGNPGYGAFNVAGLGFAAINRFKTLPAISAHPQSLTACLGDTVEFTLASSPPALAYHWQEWDPNNPGWNYLVQFSPDPNINVVALAAKDGFRYRGVASFACGLEIPTDEAVLRVFSASGPAPASQTVCAGDLVTLTVTPSDPNLVTEYRWFESASSACSGGTQVGGNSPTHQFTAAAAGTTYYRCELVAGGCTWLACPPAEVVVSAAPAVAASSNGPLCEGETLQLSADPNNLPGASYSWSGPNGFNSSSPNPLIADVSKALHEGTYTVEVVDANGCIGSAMVAVSISENEPVTASSNSPVCETELIQLSLTSANPLTLSGATFAWTGPNGFVSSQQNPGFPAGPGSAGVYDVTVTRANGCVRTAQTTVALNPSPSCAITADSAVCAQSAGLLASVPDAGPGATYAWTVAGGQLTGGAGTNQITYSAGTGASVTLDVTVTGANGCACSDSAQVTVNPLPECAIAAPAAVCADTGGYAASVPDAGPGAAYTWTISGGTITSGAGTAAIVFTAGNLPSVDLQVDVLDASGCACSGMTSIQVHPQPAVSISATPGTSACDGQSILLDAGAGFSSYLWSPGGATTQQISVVAAGVYSVTVTDANGCQNSDQLAVTFEPTPDCTITPPAGLCGGGTGYTAGVADAGAGATYLWTVNGATNVQGANTKQVTFDVPIGATAVELSVQVTSATGCECSAGPLLIPVGAGPSCAISAPASVCAGSGGHVASVPDAGPGATYAWTIAGGTILGGQGTPSIQFSAGAGPGVDLGCTVTAAGGCGCAGNLSVPVEPNLDVQVTVVLSNVAAPPGGVTRCVRYVARDGNACAGEGDVNLLFTGSPASATLVFSVPCGTALTSVCAKDEQHTLFGAATVSLVGSQYVGDADVLLAGGDTNNNSAIEINDITLLIAKFGQLAAAGGCPYTGVKDADFDNDGAVLSGDYTFLVQNWLKATTCSCNNDGRRRPGSPPLITDGAAPVDPSAAALRRTSLAIAELPADLAADVDLTGDGRFDYRDVEVFELIYGLPSTLSQALRADP